MSEFTDEQFYRDALQTIHSKLGGVCEDYTVCTHRGCNHSHGAWEVADAALRGERHPYLQAVAEPQATPQSEVEGEGERLAVARVIARQHGAPEDHVDDPLRPEDHKLWLARADEVIAAVGQLGERSEYNERVRRQRCEEYGLPSESPLKHLLMHMDNNHAATVGTYKDRLSRRSEGEGAQARNDDLEGNR